jgi:hypothetical protein
MAKKSYKKVMSRNNARRLKKTPFSVSEDVGVLDDPNVFSGSSKETPQHLRPVKDLQEEHTKGTLKHSVDHETKNYAVREEGLPISGDDLAKMGKNYVSGGDDYKVTKYKGYPSDEVSIRTSNVLGPYAPASRSETFHTARQQAGM